MESSAPSHQQSGKPPPGSLAENLGRQGFQSLLTLPEAKENIKKVDIATPKRRWTTEILPTWWSNLIVQIGSAEETSQTTSKSKGPCSLLRLLQMLRWGKTLKVIPNPKPTCQANPIMQILSSNYLDLYIGCEPFRVRVPLMLCKKDQPCLLGMMLPGL